jgi:hypothetical protein
MTRRQTNIVTITLFILCITLAAGVTLAGEKGKAYGEPMTGSKTIKISALIADPDPHLDKTVRVEGLITGVCEKRGCWMTLGSDQEFEELRIKAKDGVIVFPISAKGKHAVAEGIFTKIEMSLEQTIAYGKHHAEEHNEEFDPASITEPSVYYQINVAGALIN